MRNRILIASLLLAAPVPAQEAKGGPVVRVYDLGVLRAGMRESFYGEQPGPSEREFTLLGSSHSHELDRGDDSVEKGDPGHADLVVEVIRTFVGEIEGVFELQVVDGGRRLLARTNEEHQKTIASVLARIWGAADPPVEIDVRHLTVLDRALDDATRAALRAPGGMTAQQLAAVSRLDAHGGIRGGSLHVAAGRWGVFRAVRQLRYVADFDVEIAQAASVPDPVPAIAVDGLKVAVRPFPLRDGRLLLRVVATAGDRDAEPRRFEMGSVEVQDLLRLRNTDYRQIEQCDFRGAALSIEAVVAPGVPAVAVLASQPGPEEVRWHVLVLTVRAAPKPSGGDTFLVEPVGALVAADPERVLAWNSTSGELALLGGEDAARLSMDELVELVGDWGFYAEQRGEFRMGDTVLHGGSLLLRGTAAALRKANDSIAALERGLVRAARLDVALTVERRGGESRTAGVLSAPVTMGRKAALAAYLRMDTIGDYDAAIAQEARIADPNHTVVTAGAFANADLFENPDGSYRLHLDLTVAGAPEGIRTSAARAGGVPFVQSVPLSKRVAPIRIDLAAGRPRTLDLGPDPFSAGGDGRLVATITVQPQ